MRIGVAGSVLVLAGVLSGAGAHAGAIADEIDAELVGFLIVMPPGGLRVPPPTPAATAILEVPNEQGGPRVVFPVELDGRSSITAREHSTRGGELVVVEGVVQPGRLRVIQVRDVDVEQVRGRISRAAAPLSMPLGTDALVEIVLDGGPSSPMT